MLFVLLVLALALYPTIPLAIAHVNLSGKTEEFVKLLQVPILKGDLNRILKVCLVYSFPLTRAAHGLILKVKRPFGLDLAFHEGLAELDVVRVRVALQAAVARVLQGVALVLSIWLNLKALAPGWVPVVIAAIFVGTELARLPLRDNLARQVHGLYRLRALVYANAYKMNDGASPTQGEYVPVRYRPILLSGAELEAYKARMSDFIAGYQARKEAGEPVEDPTTEWDKADRVAGPDIVPEEPL